MNTTQYIKLGRFTALASFLIGTLIFAFYFFTSSIDFLFAGYIFIIVAGILNIFLLIALLLKVKKDKSSNKILRFTSGLILMNIPILIAYCWFASILLNTIRITLVNDSSIDLNELIISGCGSKLIKTIEAGQSKCVWISIPNDCSISMNYLAHNIKKDTLLMGYATSNMGQKITIKINE